jgi:hypothetical protein
MDDVGPLGSPLGKLHGLEEALESVQIIRLCSCALYKLGSDMQIAE